MRTIGYNIRKLREKLNYTQEFVADQIGIGRVAYGKIEGGSTFPNTKRLQQIADVLSVKPEEFYADQDTINVTASVSNSAVGNNSNNVIGVGEEVLKDIHLLLKELILLLKK